MSQQVKLNHSKIRFFYEKNIAILAAALLVAGCGDGIEGTYEKTSNRNPLMTQVKSIELKKDNGVVINGSGFTKKTTYVKNGDVLTISPNEEPLSAVYSKDKKSFELWKETFTLKSK